MSRYSDQVRDELGRAIPNTTVYVYTWDVPSQVTGELAVLTDDDLTTPLPNPLTTDEFGQFYFNWVSGSAVLIEYHYGNKLLWRDTIRENALDLTLRTDLAAVGGVSLVTGAAKTDLSNVTGANRLLTDDNVFNPIGNGNSTRGRMNLIAADSRNDIREFMFSFGADFSHGTAGTGTGGSGEKALLFLGANMLPGSFKGWALNPLLHITAGTAVEYANVAEFDIDNDKGSFGTALGAAGLTAPSVYGVTVNGANAAHYTVTAGYGLLTSSGAPLYERGYMVGPLAVVQAAFDDYSSATASYRDLGSHTYGVDLKGGTYSGSPIRLPNNKMTVARNAADNADATLIGSDSIGNLLLGDATNFTNIIARNHILPSADATKQIGSASFKYAEVHVQRLVAYPPSSVTPATNGELRIELTSNTTLTIRVKGSDGTVRSVALTLA